MKKINTFFRGIAFVLFSMFALSGFSQCNFTLEMIDSWGDGWNGNSLDLFVNGGLVFDNQTMSGSSQSVSFAVSTGDAISVVWNGGGSYPWETSYNILDNTGAVVASGDESNVSLTAVCTVLTSYCNATPSSGDGSGITSVTVGSSTYPISMPSFYQDVTGSPATLQQGINSNLDISYGHAYSYYTFAWIDFNDDYTFDASELVSSGNSSGGSGQSINLDIVVPAGADLGVHRMRIIGSDFGSSPDPCRTGSWQATVDLDVEVIVPACQQATIGNVEVIAECEGSLGPVYFVSVDVQQGGDAVSITDGVSNFPIYNTGINTVGPFNSGVTASLTVVHSDSDCDIILGDFVYNCPPVNDDCANAITVDCGTTDGTTIASTFNAPTSSCGTFLNTPGVWYVYHGTGGDIIANTCVRSYDTKLAVFEGDCSNLVCVTGNDDSCGLGSQVSFSTVEGTDYYIYVTGFSGQTGTFTLDIECVCDVYIAEGECVKVFTGYEASASTELTAVGQFGQGPYTYEWSDGQTGETITVSPTSQTTYTVTMTDSAGCTSTDSTTVLVQDISCQDNGNDNNAKVNICHDGEPLCVSTNAVQAHLNHGDTLGACDDDVNCSTAPLCDARLKVPAPFATDVSANIEISWGAATGYVVGYYLSVGTTDGGTDVLNNVDVGLALDYDLSGLLDYNTTYYVTIVPYNNIGVGTACESSYFTTSSGPWCTATPVDCNGSVSGNTATDGEVASGLSFCGTSLTSAPGVWHSFVGTGFEVTAGLCNSSYDTKIGVFTGDCAALTCVTGTDDGGSCSGFLQSEVEFQTVAGETYYVYVTGYGSNAGAYTLDLTCAGPPDVIPACESAISVDCNSTTSGSTVGYGINDFTCGTNLNTAPGRFYKVEGNGGSINVNTCSASYDTKLGVFTSTDCATLTCVGGNDDTYDCTGSYSTRSSVTFNSVNGVTYYIYVTGWSSNAGNFDLTVSCSGAREADPVIVENGEWTLYPNPASHGEVELNLTNYLNQDVSIQMMDFSGKILVNKNETNLQNPRYRLSTSGMAYGMYFVRVATDSGMSTKKLIIANN